MTVLQALVLGLLQGLAEFLPISSSAHLALTPWAFGWPAPGLAFDVALHVGTLVAVLAYFRREWVRLLLAARDIAVTRRVATEDQRRVVYLVIGTIPGAIGGLLLNEYAETVFRAPALIATTLIVMGLVLWIVDRVSPHARPLSAMRWQDALFIGVAQVLALVPGVSRSGATMTAGRVVQLDRASAATFSFLLSMPITAAAAVFKVPEALGEPGLAAPLLVGVVASGISGWLAIAVLLRYLARRSFGVFAVYRVILGVAVLLTLYARG
ncbi:MAG: undecaprenyl-diphosphatase UppP [Gemmatimonadaceae bacterium]